MPGEWKILSPCTTLASEGRTIGGNEYLPRRGLNGPPSGEAAEEFSRFVNGGGRGRAGFHAGRF